MRLIQYFISNYSTSHVLLLFLIFFGSISLCCSWILKNYFPSAIINDAVGNQAASILFTMFTGFYALLLAFIIVMLWGGISESQRLILKESSELAVLTRLDAAAEPSTNQLKPAIKQYIDAIVNFEWSLFQKGISGEVTEKYLDSLYTAVLGISPKNFQERIAYTEMIQVLANLADTHRDRVANATGKTLPDVILYTVFFGGLIISILITQIGGMRKRQQYLLHVIVSVFIAVNVGLIFVMNVPYSLNIFKIDPYYIGILNQYK